MRLSERVQERAYQRRWLILLVLCFSLLVIVLDNTILNVAIPTLSRELDPTNSQLQWMVDSYTLVFAGLLLTAGSLGDRFGRRGALQIGLVIFGLGSLFSALASTANQLIATRAFMGIGGALIMPATLSIITNVFPAKERGRAIGAWAGTAGIAVALGPLTGGFLLEHFYWGSVFLVNLPIVAIGLVAGIFLIPTSSIGWSVWRSHRPKPTSVTRPRASAPRMTGSVQPSDGASMMAYSRPVRPTIDSTAPTGSSFGADGSLDVGMSR